MISVIDAPVAVVESARPLALRIVVTDIVVQKNHVNISRPAKLKIRDYVILIGAQSVL